MHSLILHALWLLAVVLVVVVALALGSERGLEVILFRTFKARATLNMMRAVILAVSCATAVLLQPVLALSEISMESVPRLKPPAVPCACASPSKLGLMPTLVQVVLFFNGSEATTTVAALREIENIESGNEEFKFYKCDTSEEPEAAQKVRDR